MILFLLKVHKPLKFGTLKHNVLMEVGYSLLFGCLFMLRFSRVFFSIGLLKLSGSFYITVNAFHASCLVCAGFDQLLSSFEKHCSGKEIVLLQGHCVRTVSSLLHLAPREVEAEYSIDTCQ